MDYLNDHVIGITVGAGTLIALGAAYYCRSNAPYIASWLVDKYVDLKWSFMGSPDIGADLSSGVRDRDQSNDRCQLCMKISRSNSEEYILYRYRDSYYLSQHDLPPRTSDLDAVYDDSNRISNITVYDNYGKIELPDPEKSRLSSLIDQYAGPLLDFHGKLPSITDIISDPELDIPSVKCIVVVTENYAEYVIGQFPEPTVSDGVSHSS